MTKANVEKQLAQQRVEREERALMIRKYEAEAANDPAGYRRKLDFFSRLGHLYMFGVFLFLLLLLVGIVALIVTTRQGGYIAAKFGIIILIVIAGIVKAVWVKVEKPEGVSVPKEHFPELYREVDMISQKLGAPKIDEIVLDADVNAAAAEVPRFSVAGWPRLVLVLGTPLMVGMSREELRSVIAHELGHFSGRHGQLGVRIYRAHAVWDRLGQHFAQHGGGGAWLFTSFVKWYMPKLSAMSFAMRREHEFHADAAEVETVGAEVSGASFMRMSVLGEALSEGFWKPLQEVVRTNAAPPEDLGERLLAWSKSSADPVTAAQAIRVDLKEETGVDDSHPALADRLRHIGFETEGRVEVLAAVAVKPREPNAAEAIFGARMSGFLGLISIALHDTVAPNWLEGHKEFAELGDTLAKLESKARNSQLSQDEQLEYAYATYRLRGAKDGETLYSAYVEKYPNDPNGLVTLAKIRLELDDGSGVELANRAYALDTRYYAPAYSLLYRFYRKRGDFDSIKTLSGVSEELYDKTTIDWEAEQHFLLTDNYRADEWPPEQLEAFRTQAAGVKGIEEAYVLEKQLPATGRWHPCLIVLRKKALVEGENAAGELLKKILAFKDLKEVTAFIPDKPKDWKRKLEELKIAPIYRVEGN